MINVGAMMKLTIRDWAAKTLVEEKKKQCYLYPFGSQPISIVAAVAL